MIEKVNKITEKEIIDNERLELCSGIRWVDNDIVNFISNVVSLLIGSILKLDCYVIISVNRV